MVTTIPVRQDRDMARRIRALLVLLVAIIVVHACEGNPPREDRTFREGSDNSIPLVRH